MTGLPKEAELTMPRTRFAVFLLLVLSAAPDRAGAEAPVFDPASPFRVGEGFAEVPATCDTLQGWMDRAPAYDGRYSMTITGALASSQWDGALAYLSMCDPAGPRVICVTYQPHEVDPQVSVLLAGGYQRIDEKTVLLDPCLAYDE
ncbi:hypothetical protein [Fulvimarina sp. MAC8]|uniref:hypothetical protein n=1 Tax=Fulvimarina sp. MAC8 TaxID=3162874 RepID=UPI0032EC72D3